MLGASLVWLANNWEDTADRIAIASLRIAGETLAAAQKFKMSYDPETKKFVFQSDEADRIKDNMNKQIAAIKHGMDVRNGVAVSKTKEGQDSQTAQMEAFFKKQKEILKKFYVDEASLIQAEEGKKKRDGLASYMRNHFRDMKLPDKDPILAQQNWLNRVPEKKDLKTTPEGNYPYLDIPKMESVMDKIEASEYESLRRRAANHSWFAITVARYRDWETDRKSTRLNSSH